jgi:Neuraminidase (sialidase)
VPYVSFADARADGTHTDWSVPQPLPQPPHTPQGATYLLPHVAPDGAISTTVTNFNPRQGFCCTSVFVDTSTDGGATWSVAGTAVSDVTPPPGIYPNTTFRDGIEFTFTVGNQLDAQGQYPLFVAYEDFSAGAGNVMLTASYDGGATWTGPIQVNDNASPADEFQPNLTVAPDGTVSVNFYDRRLACPAAGTTQATAAGLA